MQGIFITFEGPEGAGKTTQLNLLYDYLIDRNFPVERTREPGGTRIGRNIREILLNNQYNEMDPYCEVLLYAADRAQNVAQRILPALREGRVVLSDRFVDASIVYQGFGRGINLDFVRQVNSLAIRDCKPDITFLLDIPPEQGLQRVRDAREVDRIEEEDFDFHRRIREGYLYLAKEEKERFVVIRADQDLKLIHDQVIDRLLPLLKDLGREEEGLK